MCVETMVTLVGSRPIPVYLCFMPKIIHLSAKKTKQKQQMKNKQTKTKTNKKQKNNSHWIVIQTSSFDLH